MARCGSMDWGLICVPLAGCAVGDQGFCLSATDLKGLQGYPEQASYGEDHLLVWKAGSMG